MHNLKLLILIICLLIILLTGCISDTKEGGINVFSDWGLHMFSGLKNTDNVQTDQVFEQLISFIECSNEKGITSLFAEDIIEMMDNWDEDVLLLLDFFEGELVSYSNKGSSASEAREGNIRVKEIIVSYDVITTVDDYRVALKYCMMNTNNKCKVGLHSVYFIKAKDTDPQLTYWGGHIWMPGIVIESKSVAN